MAEYIEREALHKSMSFNITDDPGCPLFVAATVHQTIDCAPAADVRPVIRGKWEDVYDNSKEREVTRCSICHCITIYFDSPFCQWCGAKMDGEDGEDNE